MQGILPAGLKGAHYTAADAGRAPSRCPQKSLSVKPNRTPTSWWPHSCRSVGSLPHKLCPLSFRRGSHHYPLEFQSAEGEAGRPTQQPNRKTGVEWVDIAEEGILSCKRWRWQHFGHASEAQSIVIDPSRRHRLAVYLLLLYTRVRMKVFVLASAAMERAPLKPRCE